MEIAYICKSVIINLNSTIFPRMARETIRTMRTLRLLAFLFPVTISAGLTAMAQQDKLEMAHYILRNLPDGEVYRNAFTMLENDAQGSKGWHNGMFGFCKEIYAQDSIADGDLSFAELTLESLASSEKTPKDVVFNSSSILGNIAFNARDYSYMVENIERMQNASEKLGKSAQLQAAIEKLQGRKDLIKGYSVPFKDRMKGTWVSAEVNYSGKPDMFLEIMDDSIRINPFKEFITEIGYDKDGNIKKDFRYPELGTKEIVESADRRQMAAFFGYSQLDKGNPMLASAIANVSEQWSGAMTRSAAYRNRKNPYSAGAVFSSFTSSLAGMLGMALAASLSETVKYTKLNNIYLTEIVPGIVRMDREYVEIKESSQTGTTETHYPQSLYLYKITAADSLIFTGYSPEKFKEPYAKDMCAVAGDVIDEDAYLEHFNSAIADSIERRRVDLDSIYSDSKWYIGSKVYKAAIYANHFMREPLAKAVLKRLNGTPEGLIDDRTQLDIYRDIVYHTKNQDVFDDMVKIDGFEGRDNAWFSGTYSNKYFIGYWDRPKMLLKLLAKESRLPNGEPVFWRTDMDGAAKDLQKNLYPIYGVMTWEKKGKKYRYEGEFADRKFHGKGKLWENDVLIHDGGFVKGEPVVEKK